MCFLFPDLHLTVITPLVRTNVNGIRVRDGLAMRRPMFEDDLMEDADWEEIVRKLDKFYTGKDGKVIIPYPASRSFYFRPGGDGQGQSPVRSPQRL